MVSRNLVSVLLCFVFMLGAQAFPADVERCHAGDVECIRKSAVNLLHKYSKTGYPEAGFPVLEPFTLKKFDISDGRSGSLSFKLNFKDVLVGGLSNVNFDKMVGFEADPKTSKFELYGSLPKLTLRGKYTADGRILVLPIQGDGDADITIVKPKFSVKFKPSLNNQGGKTYLGIDKLKILIEPEKVQIKLTNLFHGDKTLGENLNLFLNENWSDVWTELQPSIHVAISEIVRSVALNVFKKFPYEDLYLHLPDQFTANQPILHLKLDTLSASWRSELSEELTPIGTLPRFSQGYSALNLVGLNPLKISEIRINQGAESPVNIDLKLKNSELTGIKDAKVLHVKGFGKNIDQVHEMTLESNSVSLNGDYTIKGRVLILPINGNGKSNITMENVRLKMSLLGESVVRDGETYMNVKNVKLNIDTSRLYFEFLNLFNGDKTLGDNMNLFLNENWKDIYGEVRGSITSAFASIFQSVVNNVFSNLLHFQSRIRVIFDMVNCGIIFLIVLVLIVSSEGKLPSDIKPCKAGDQKCLIETINKIIETKYMGDPDLNLISIDPLHIDFMEVKQPKASPVSIDLSFRNSEVYGYKNFRVFKVRGFGENPEGKHSVYFKGPAASLVGDYKIDGKILILPIVGEGKSNITLEDVYLKVMINGGSKVENDHIYLDVKELKLNLNTSQVHFDMSNLFNGDKALGDNLNKFMNENWEDIYLEIKGAVLDGFAKSYTGFIRALFASHPYSELIDGGK
ncbi:uncharacterized protein LOC129945005 [Eupeodes corollae]|uniref:uncharacterized protein LOC129945005 n=1 Tax=Eupeodes corollae TaxID=290404 RepID=UPI0024935D3E|nr:uncharacterized protein LOC129945005 [Eupeodes corollae]